MYEFQVNYENLANAIIIQAVYDYRNSSYFQTRNAIKRFMRSDWFKILTTVDGELLIDKLEQERLAENE